MQEMQERVDDYLAVGVRCVWVIHPHTRRVFTYTHEGVSEARDGVLRLEDRNIRVTLADLD
jgi:hypothetical protein